MSGAVLRIFPMLLFLQKVGFTLSNGTPAEICPSSRVRWTNLEGSNCYFLKQEKIQSWERALEDCVAKGGSLASFHSRAEIDRVRKMFSLLRHEDSPFIGLHRLSNGSIKWSDGTAVTFLNFPTTTSLTASDTCSTMGYYTGNWYAVKCNATASYLCSTPKRIPCDHGTCKNGGYCGKDGINELFPCTCKHGFLGLTCDKRIMCSSGPCRNGGTCQQNGLNGEFTCTCQHGYEGRICEKMILCDGSLCKNGGSCSHDDDVDGIFRCHCAQGYKGLTCEERDNTLLTLSICLGLLFAIFIFIALFFVVRQYRRRKAPDPKQLQASAYKNKDRDSLESCHMTILDDD